MPRPTPILFCTAFQSTFPVVTYCFTASLPPKRSAVETASADFSTASLPSTDDTAFVNHPMPLPIDPPTSPNECISPPSSIPSAVEEITSSVVPPAPADSRPFVAPIPRTILGTAISPNTVANLSGGAIDIIITGAPSTIPLAISPVLVFGISGKMSSIAFFPSSSLESISPRIISNSPPAPPRALLIRPAYPAKAFHPHPANEFIPVPMRPA